MADAALDEEVKKLTMEVRAASLASRALTAKPRTLRRRTR
jgi:hypothetical protein